MRDKEDGRARLFTDVYINARNRWHADPLNEAETALMHYDAQIIKQEQDVKYIMSTEDCEMFCCDFKCINRKKGF